MQWLLPSSGLSNDKTCLLGQSMLPNALSRRRVYVGSLSGLRLAENPQSRVACCKLNLMTYHDSLSFAFREAFTQKSLSLEEIYLLLSRRDTERFLRTFLRKCVTSIKQ